ncbi:MAG: hypothetical protein IKK57_12470 [Clostridia bacterium]|nr:hypothetical protein [Clostridia bacterium]
MENHETTGKARETTGKKRTLLVNLAAVAAVLALALGAYLLSEALPARDITPNAGTLEEAGIVFTPDEQTADE